MVYQFSPWVICLSLSMTGVILGAVFDLYRTLRFFFEPGRLITALGDLAYWTGVTALIFGLFSLLAGGEMRVYFFMFLCLGVALYYVWVSAAALRTYQLLGRLLQRLFGFIQAVITRIITIFLAPLRWVIRILSGPVRWLLSPWRRMGRCVRNWRERYRRPPEPPAA